jgi:hypothetical protein
MIDPEHALSLTRQSRILELSRSSLYYEAIPTSKRDVELILLIDEIHLKYPFYGIRRIRNELRDLGHDIGRSHVSTLMKKMGIRALYPKPRLSKPNPENERVTNVECREAKKRHGDTVIRREMIKKPRRAHRAKRGFLLPLFCYSRRKTTRKEQA